MSLLPSNRDYTKGPLKLVELSNRIPLVIPDSVLHKIKYLCLNIPRVEWSGPLFYTHEGDITKPETFKVTLQDLLPLDKGTAAFTSYQNDGRFVDYMMDTPEALDWNMGHCHSHNIMKVFFSGTDTDELVDNAPNYNFYVSLIVNNAMEMVARIAFETIVEETVKNVPQWAISQEGKKFIFKKAPISVTQKFIYYYDCDVIYTKEEPFVDKIFADRVEEIMKPKPAPVYGNYNAYQKPVQTAPIKNLPAKSFTPVATNVLTVHDFSENFAKEFNFEETFADEEALEVFLCELFSLGILYDPTCQLDYIIEQLENTEGQDSINLARKIVESYSKVYIKMFPTATPAEFIKDGKYSIDSLIDLEEVYPYIKPTIKALESMIAKFQEL